MLKRSLFKDELEPNWPSPDKVNILTQYDNKNSVLTIYFYVNSIQLWDWDMWMRLDVIRKGRYSTLFTPPLTISIVPLYNAENV